MPILNPSFVSPRELRTKTPDGRDLVFLSGYAEFAFVGDGPAWRRDDLHLRIGPAWIPTPQVVPIVVPASFQNDGPAENAGWAVDDCAVEFVIHEPEGVGVQVHLTARLAVRDVDGQLRRIAYSATVLGTLLNV